MTRGKQYAPFSSLIFMLIAVTLIWIFWNSLAVYPVKIMVVFLHELSHGLAAVVTGGSIEKIVVNANEGGLCYTRGGNHFIIVSAGYLGSMLWGGLILYLSSRTRLDKTISMLLGIILVAVTALFIRNSFGLAYGLVTGSALILLSLKGSEALNDLVLRIIGLTSILYVLLDIRDDLILTPARHSDATIMAKTYGGPALFWALLWMGLALIFAYLLLKRLLSR